MCGIYCKILKKEIIDSLNEYDEKLKLLDHRGPDNRTLIQKKNIILGHTRLSILDTSHGADQPFSDDNYMLVYNGEIYNYLQLQEKYLQDIKLKTHSDTEVLFELLKLYGSKILHELNGMFAFVFVNFKINNLIVARDLSGIKPLYYILGDNFFEIASEIKSLSYEISKDKLKNQILEGTFQDGNLPYSNVDALEGGQCIEFNFATYEFEQKEFKSFLANINETVYLSNSRVLESSLVSNLEDLLDKSVRLHLQSDAPIGALCSGGVDSSLLSALSMKYNKNIKLYHAGVEGFGGEEEYAEMVSRHLNQPITYIKMNKEEYWKDFAYLTFISDLPIYHPNDLSLNAIAKIAHQDGIKVMLSGEGADELFGGYSWHQRLMKQYRLAKILNKKDSLLRQLSGSYSKTLKNGFDNFTINDIQNYMPLGLGYFDMSVDLFARSYIFQGQNFKNWKRFQSIKNAYGKLNISELEKYMQSTIHFNTYGHLGSILHRTDRILMANSIEGRVPFLENDIIDFSMNLPLKYKINKRFKKEGKYLLKKVAEAYLPQEVIYRPKAGFPVPFHEYIKDIEKIFEKGFCREYTNLSLSELKNFYHDSPHLKFRMLALEVYGRIFIWKQNYHEIVME
jgi:asparagine synthase (glutamine-hydrolysing)